MKRKNIYGAEILMKRESRNLSINEHEEMKIMIKGVHTMFYTSQVEELRKFIKEKLQFTYSDLGDGWLIFDLPEADMGCHPSETEDGKQSGTHNISLCPAMLRFSYTSRCTRKKTISNHHLFSHVLFSHRPYRWLDPHHRSGDIQHNC